MISFSLAIIAGGKSSRMGTDKAFVHISGKPILSHIVEKTRDLGQSETLLITNRPEDYAEFDIPMYTDVIPDKGSLGGIYTAIYHSQSLYTLVIACDMPFISPDLLRFMLSQIENATPQPDVVVPRVGSYPQGLHAVYSKGCLGYIRDKLDANRLKVIGFYDDVNVCYLDEDEYRDYDGDGYAFFNVNTPEDLEEARQYAHKIESS